MHIVLLSLRVLNACECKSAVEEVHGEKARWPIDGEGALSGGLTILLETVVYMCIFSMLTYGFFDAN